MKRLWISFAIVFLLLSLAWIHVLQLKQLTASIIDHIEQASEHLYEDAWGKAAYEAQLASELWESNAFYLHATLRHTDLDSIRGSLMEIRSYTKQADDKAECLAAAAQLINQLELLLEAELPTLKNIL